MPAQERWRRQIEPPALALITHARARGLGSPIPAVPIKRRARLSGADLDHVGGLARLRSHDAVHARLQDARLLEGDRGQAVAEETLVIERDRRQYRDDRALDHVGRIEPAAEPHLQQGCVRRRAAEGEKRRRRGDLEQRDRHVRVRPLTFLETGAQRIVLDQRARNPDALGEAHEVRRGVDVHAIAGALQAGAQRRHRRALAIGASDMDHRRQLAMRRAA